MEFVYDNMGAAIIIFTVAYVAFRAYSQKLTLEELLLNDVRGFFTKLIVFTTAVEWWSLSASAIELGVPASRAYGGFAAICILEVVTALFFVSLVAEALADLKITIGEGIQIFVAFTLSAFCTYCVIIYNLENLGLIGLEFSGGLAPWDLFVVYSLYEYDASGMIIGPLDEFGKLVRPNFITLSTILITPCLSLLVMGFMIKDAKKDAKKKKSKAAKEDMSNKSSRQQTNNPSTASLESMVADRKSDRKSESLSRDNNDQAQSKVVELENKSSHKFVLVDHLDDLSHWMSEHLEVTIPKSELISWLGERIGNKIREDGSLDPNGSRIVRGITDDEVELYLNSKGTEGTAPISLYMQISEKLKGDSKVSGGLTDRGIKGLKAIQSEIEKESQILKNIRVKMISNKNAINDAVESGSSTGRNELQRQKKQLLDNKSNVEEKIKNLEGEFDYVLSNLIEDMKNENLRLPVATGR